MLETLFFIFFLGLCCTHCYVRSGKHFVLAGLIIPLIVVLLTVILTINLHRYTIIIYGQGFLNVLESILVVNQVRLRFEGE
ncbi:hypothetical protein LNP10_03585 [Apilactobacillus nanyangensis]|uniref:Uncharacterized protein n=1 Tax=Apilactobacillus nanyangensis TaxID=2799579 RepID=A0ABT0HYV1_9LACO|nr:hypothetical protein [Apilactobacillus nanyangensis]MCK8611577.1 hypothetical protein [Apilactobacillus nanyangensis]